jgi:hypothetical protein
MLPAQLLHFSQMIHVLPVGCIDMTCHVEPKYKESNRSSICVLRCGLHSSLTSERLVRGGNSRLWFRHVTEEDKYFPCDNGRLNALLKLCLNPQRLSQHSSYWQDCLMQLSRKIEMFRYNQKNFTEFMCNNSRS